MRAFIQIFAAALALDALLGLAAAWPPVAVVRPFVTAVAVGLAVIVYGGAAFTRNVGVWPVLAAIYVAWAAIGAGFPLPFVWPAGATAAIAAGELALALGTWVSLRRRDVRGGGFSWGRCAGLALLAVAGLPLLFAAGLATAGAQAVEARTAGYVKVRAHGLLLEEREFTRDDRRVRLIGMMHIGNREFYEHVHRSLPGDGPTVVLLEGVTDREGVLRNRFSYGKIANLLGLSSQETSALQRGVAEKRPDAPAKVDYQSADVDVASFSALTRECLRALGAVLSDPTRETFLRVFGEADSPLQRPEANAAVTRDLLENRNAHLLGEIRRALAQYGVVVVPWGALHLPDIEAALLAQGFRETRRAERPVIAW